MAHYQQLQFVSIVQKIFPQHFFNSRVLEVGSWNKNGTIKKYFSGGEYLGVDIAAGNGVDLICPGQRVEYPSDYFDTVISCECFEHNPYWLETFINMIRMLRPGGLCLISCASIGRGEHGTKRCQKDASLTAANDELGNYYRNLDESDFACLDLSKHFQEFSFYRNVYSKDLYFLGIKKERRTVDGLEERFLSVASHLRDVTTEKEVSSVSATTAYISWMLKYLLAKALGERRYHHIKYQLKTTSRRLRGKIIS
ncbi:MAG: methyltransferase domain-containing protein [Ottowia sp.]|nr:methyltransferase domain-containing protein [Ottowia sp.]